MTRDLTQGNPVKLMLAFSVPLLIGNVFQQFYNMVDSIIVGQYLGMQALAAVGISGSIIFLILGFCMGLTGGFSVVIAQRFGAGDEDELRHSVAMSTLLCLLISVVLTVISVSTTWPLLELMNTPADTIQAAYDYVVVIFYGISASVFYNMISGVLRALGDSKTPLYFLIVASVLNVMLDIVFIRYFYMGVAGAAWATIIAQAVSGFLCLFYTAKKFPILKFQRKDWKIRASTCGLLMKIGSPMAFQFSITAVGVMVLQGAINRFGSVMVAGFSAAAKVEQLIEQPLATMGVTIATYAGQNYGAGKIDRLKEGVRKCTLLTLAATAFGMLIAFFFWEPLVRLFITGTDEQTIGIALSAAQQYLYIVIIFLVFLGLLFVYRNVLQGVGQSFMPLMGGVAELVIRVAVALLAPLIGYAGVCFATPIAWVAAAIPLMIAWFIYEKKALLRPAD